MKDAVVIKSFPNGITLLLNKEASFDEIIQEIAFKFTEARSFFGDVKMALSLKGREVSQEEEIVILDTIKKHSDVTIICLVGQDGEEDRNFSRVLQDIKCKVENEGQFYRGTLQNRDVLETDNSIIVLGDIYYGSTVISTRNIIVLGGLYGEAYAGGNGQSSAYVVALEMEPDTLKIGDFKYKCNRQPRWGTHLKVHPKIAYVKNSRIVFEPLTKDLLDSF